jgi:hypothetical protein
MIAAATAATGLVIAQRKAFTTGEKLAFVQGQLSQLKESISDGKIANANERAAEANKIAEQERFARVLLESKVAWRKLDAKARADIAAKLIVFSGEPALIAYKPDDVEAASFASDIVTLLNIAKWNVPEPLEVLSMREGPVPVGTNPRLSTGVNVWSTDDEVSRNAANMLVKLLRSRGFDADISPEERSLLSIHPTPTRVVVSVAHKPEGAQGDYKLNQIDIVKP